MIRVLTISLLLTSSVARADSIPLHYDPNLVARGFPSPVVRVSIPGQAPAQFLIDTGASVHTLAEWFVKSANIPADLAKGTARGSTGKETTIRVARQTDLALEDGHRLPLEEAIVVDFPPMFAELRIAGLLSPQLFARRDEAVILDLRTPSLDTAPLQVAVDRLHIEPLSSGRVCINQDSEFRNRIYSMNVSVLGRSASMGLDSGATGSVIGADSAVARKLASRSIEGNHTQGLGGDAEAFRHVPAVKIRRAGTSVDVDLVIGRSPSPECGLDGLLGMDALRQCVLVLGPSALGMSCSR